MENKYEQYATLDAQIRELTAKKDQVKLEIISEMNDKGENKVESDFGKFTITKLKKWIYPEKVLDLEEKFKSAKAKAESTGEATYEEQDSLRFTSIRL